MARAEGALPRTHRPWAAVIRSFAFVRKELAEILRQPRLLLLLVFGPFLLLLLFGLGYAEHTLTMRAVFVGPPDSIYEEVIARYEDDLEEFVENVGYIDDEAVGRRMVEDGEADAMVVFPLEPIETVRGGERAVIRVVHNQLDPIEQTAIATAARLAVHEVNATVLSSLAGETQDGLAAAVDVADRVSEAATDAAEQGTSDAELAADVNELSALLQDILTVDPDVLVEPFESQTETLLPSIVEPIDYFTPASLALLLQHLALTFAALSLVRDRRSGLFELLRMGPMSSFEILVGKAVAYLLIGVVVAAALIASAVYILDVPLAGPISWLAVIVVGLILSSLALGLVLSAMSSTESQAVQFAMLVLLAGMFFSGFVLGLDGLDYPVRLISFALPVTYGIRALQTIMLQGEPPGNDDLIGLAVTTAVFGAIAVVALRRKLRQA